MENLWRRLVSAGKSQFVKDAKAPNKQGFKKQEKEKNIKQNYSVTKDTEESLDNLKYSVDDFDLLKTLGTGSFGRVFLSRYKADDSVFAIKRLKKNVVIRQKQVDHINNEKSILSKIKHPFLIEMYGTFKDEKYLYIIMEYVIGGEFFTYLRKCRHFDSETTRFYAGQVILMFEYLHNQNIIYRDLKPENILIDEQGYLKLTDFGFAKIIEYRTFTLCGTPEYIAPEVLLNKGHGKPVDWWTLGILIYEMIVGFPPFYDDEPMGIYQKILSGKIFFPKYFDKNCKNLVKRLLTPDLTKRYGNLKGGINDIKYHKWFSNFDFSVLLARKITPPYIPKVKSKDDASNFEEYPESYEKPADITGSSDPFIDW